MTKNLQLKGWCINEQALDLELDLAEQSDRLDDVKRLEEFLLDTDLKEVGNPVLYEKFDRKKGELVGPLILQLTKWRNLNYPAVNNHDRNDGVCSMTLSDGHSSIKTVSIDSNLKVDGNTAYGSKILLTGKIRSENGFLLLNNKNTSNLGGNVEKLVEKWKTEKFSGNERSSTTAPKWVPFSKAKNMNIKFDKNFRTLQQADNSDDKELDEKTIKFNEARKAEIEALNVQIPKPIQELNERLRNTSLSDSNSTPPNSSRQNRQFNNDQQFDKNQRPPKQFDQQNKRNFDNRNRNENQFDNRNRNENQFGNRNENQFDNRAPPQRNQSDNRHPPQRNQFDNRPPPQRNQFDNRNRNENQSDSRPQQRNQFNNRPPQRNEFDNRNRSENQRQPNARTEQSNDYPREFRPSRGNQRQTNTRKEQPNDYPQESRPIRGNQRGRGRGGNQRGRGSGRGSNNDYQQPSQQQRGITLNLDLDFPQLGL